MFRDRAPPFHKCTAAFAESNRKWLLPSHPKRIEDIETGGGGMSARTLQGSWVMACVCKYSSFASHKQANNAAGTPTDVQSGGELPLCGHGACSWWQQFRETSIIQYLMYEIWNRYGLCRRLFCSSDDKKSYDSATRRSSRRVNSIQSDDYPFPPSVIVCDKESYKYIFCTNLRGRSRKLQHN